MRIFLYEFVTGGGWMFEFPPAIPFLAEARAMVRALASDLAQVPDVEVVLLRDARWPPPSIPGVQVELSDPPDGDGNLSSVLHVARKSDAAIVIAPEFKKILLDYVEALEQAGIKLLSPWSQHVFLASDKLLTHRNLQKYVPVPPTFELVGNIADIATELSFPVVVKPKDGCGSMAVQLVRSPADEIDWSDMFSGDAIVQEFVSGLAVSVGLLCGPSGSFPLPACMQRLSDDGYFQYRGGECPLSSSLNQRAQDLARRAIGCLAADCGYVGVDLILGAAEDGSQDYVIEINPRLTTSYVGLRALSKTNLAQAMLDVALGREPQLDWKPGRVRWTAAGKVEYFEQ